MLQILCSSVRVKDANAKQINITDYLLFIIDIADS